MGTASVGSAKFLSSLNFVLKGAVSVSTKCPIITRAVPWDFTKGPSSSIWTYFDDCFYSSMCCFSPQKPWEARQYSYSLFFRRADLGL